MSWLWLVVGTLVGFAVGYVACAVVHLRPNGGEGD